MHESKRERIGFKENGGCVRRRERGIGEGELGSLDKNH